MQFCCILLTVFLQALLLLAVGLTLGQDQLRPILHQSLGFGLDGQYQYNYNSDIDSRQEVRDGRGQTLGSYSYVDEKGMLQRAEYVAGLNGFQISATNLPKDTPEVAAAKAQHEAAVNYARSILPPLPPEPVKPQPVIRPQISRNEQLDHISAEVARAKAAYERALRAQEEETLSKQSVLHFPAAMQPQIVLQTTPKPQITAEQIPRSEFGETPEVALARKEHLAALALARSNLPVLPEFARRF